MTRKSGLKTWPPKWTTTHRNRDEKPIGEVGTLEDVMTSDLIVLERLATEQWPFEQFRKALEDPGMDGTKPESRWQVLNASLNAIKRVVGRGSLPVT